MHDIISNNHLAISAGIGVVITIMFKAGLNVASKKIFEILFNIHKAYFMFAGSIIISLASFAFIYVTTPSLRIYNYNQIVSNSIVYNLKGYLLLSELCPDENEISESIKNNLFSEPLYTDINKVVSQLPTINQVTLSVFDQWNNRSLTCSQFYYNGKLISPIDVISIHRYSLNSLSDYSPEFISLIQNTNVMPTYMTDIVYNNSKLESELIGKLTVTESFIFLNNKIYIPLRGESDSNILYGYITMESTSEIKGSRESSVGANIVDVQMNIEKHIKELKKTYINEVLQNGDIKTSNN